MINKNKKSLPYKFIKKNTLNYEGVVPSKIYFDNNEDYEFYNKNYTVFNLKKISIEYCFRDIDILFEILNNLFNLLKPYFKKNNILKNSFSFSSVSFKIFKTKFDVFKITSKKTPLNIDKYFRNAYYGGRCEVFGNPESDEIIHYFDFKGMYAQCMLEKFPHGKLNLKHQNLSINNPGFHTIQFECDDYLPFLPIRADKLIFPNGKLIGTYWYEEIINAVKHKKCKILNHFSSIEFECEDYLFKDFVNEFLNLRERGSYYNFFCKNVINGLYGSFALNEDDSFFVISMDQSEFSFYHSKVDVISFTKIGNAYIIKIKKNIKSKKIFNKKNNWDLDNKKRNLSYAAIISSKARIKLNNSLNDVINAGGRLYYTDTDSIFAGFKKNYKNKKLKEIEWEKTFEDGIFISNKFYFLKNQKLVLKGVNEESDFYSYNEIKLNFYKNEDQLLEFPNQLNFMV